MATDYLLVNSLQACLILGQMFCSEGFLAFSEYSATLF